MVTTIEAVFDGEVLRPKKPLKLKADTHVRITIETLGSSKDTTSFLDIARSLNLDGPADWAENLDKYLYDEKKPE